MTGSRSARTRTRRSPALLAATLAVAATAVVAAHRSPEAPSPASGAPTVASGAPAVGSAVPAPAPGVLPPGDRAAVGEADGVLPSGATVLDDDLPGVARLDPALRDALRRAAAEAADAGVTVVVTSGWRSPEYQDQLFREAVTEYGSAEEAARWVATADTSAHVSGDAVDVGPAEATAWLSEHGADHGLCQVYGNEPWHHELRPEAVDHGCPRVYADPTEDPRMQQARRSG